MLPPGRLCHLRRILPLFLAIFILAAGLLASQDVASGHPGDHSHPGRQALDKHNWRDAWWLHGDHPPLEPSPLIADNFEVHGHSDLGVPPGTDAHGDVWAHGDFAYVGSLICGRGVSIVDVSDLDEPQLIGTLAATPDENTEDVVVRRVKTKRFKGDLLAVGMQGPPARCFFPEAPPDEGPSPEPPHTEGGVQLWDVSDPYHPQHLSTFGHSDGVGHVHELDLFQRGKNVYALLAVPFAETFNEPLGGEIRIVDVTDPRNPVQVGEFGAIAAGLITDQFTGIGSDPITLGHSARASEDGKKVYVSYWDLGVITLDITDVTNPKMIGRTQYPQGAEGAAHSLTEYDSENGRLLLQNDEDFDPSSPASVLYGPGPTVAPAIESSLTLLWTLPGQSVTAEVVQAANYGCMASDYPADTAGKIAVVPFDPDVFFVEFPPCQPFPSEQAIAAEAAGAVGVIYAFSLPCCPDVPPFPGAFHEGAIPTVFVSAATAQEIIAAGLVTLQGQEPTSGFLRVFDAKTGVQAAKFDAAPNVHAGFESPAGVWTIHNTEVLEDRAYSSWYSNGIVALDLSPLDEEDDPSDPVMVGQFAPPGTLFEVPPGEPLPEPFPQPPLVWGVAVREDGVIFASDILSGLWIVEPTGPAAAEDDEDRDKDDDDDGDREGNSERSDNKDDERARGNGQREGEDRDDRQQGHGRAQPLPAQYSGLAPHLDARELYSASACAVTDRAPSVAGGESSAPSLARTNQSAKKRQNASRQLSCPPSGSRSTAHPPFGLSYSNNRAKTETLQLAGTPSFLPSSVIKAGESIRSLSAPYRDCRRQVETHRVSSRT
jgi:hypothetical protein